LHTKAWNSLGWFFPTIGASVLVFDVMLAANRAKDAWVLQDIVLAFIVFSLLLGFGLLLGQSRLAVPNAAIALAVLAIIPSVKYGFVYGAFDAFGHYGTAVVIARTGSLAASAMYSELYAGNPLMHILLAMTGLTAGIPVEAAMISTLFIEHFAIFVLVAESVRRVFPQLDRRLIVFLTMMTLPVSLELVGTTYGLLSVAMITYFWLTMIREESTRREVLVTAVLLMVSLVFSHFVTALYFLIALTCYSISLLVMKRHMASTSTAKRDLMLGLVLLYFVIFLSWLAYVGQNIIYVVRAFAIDTLTGSPLPSAAGQFPLLDLVQILLLKHGRALFSMLTAVAISSVVLLRKPKTKTFLVFWSLLAGSLLIGVPPTLGHEFMVHRFLAYGSLVAPYFLCSVLSRQKDPASLLNANTPRIRLLKAAILVGLVVSMVATYPITPLYPKYAGSPTLDDNDVNSVYVVSALDYFSSVYSSEPVLTSYRIFWQLLSLHPEVMHLAYNTISPHLEEVTSPSELKGHFVVFDAGGRSGTATVAMRTFLAGNLTDKLAIVYSNGLFYMGIA
jgi:hypothetical protein